MNLSDKNIPDKIKSKIKKSKFLQKSSFPISFASTQTIDKKRRFPEQKA